jgi:predicted alpha/beta superfamily hydrolase
MQVIPETDVHISTLQRHELCSRVFRNTRMLHVWLPPGYGGSGAERYPVLYLNDGQNLFDPATAFAGVHWAVAESAERLIAEGKIPPLLIVGIDNMGRKRIKEYIPYRSFDPPVLTPRGTRYPEFFRDEVMPFIEGRYAVAKGAENTGLGGSSLGGLITLYTHLAAPGVFGRLLIESPSLFVSHRRILKESWRASRWPSRVYLGMGTRETGNPLKDERLVQDVRELQRILRAAGLGDEQLKVSIEEGAPHSEAAWAARFPQALEFLFAGRR